MPAQRVIFSAFQCENGLLVLSGIFPKNVVIPPLDWQLSADGVRSVAIRCGSVCQELPGISAGACADYTPDLQEFHITYHTPQGNRTLVSALVPVY